jgi:DNA-binding NarL/FixJ family response regulator
MSTETNLAIVVDTLEFRRACITSLLGGWAAAEEIALLPLSPEEAHQKLRNETECRVVILNVGAAASSHSDVLAEIMVLRAMAPAAALVVVADREDPGDVMAAMQAGAEAYVSNLLPPDLIFRTLSFVLHGGTYFPRSIVDHGPTSDGPELEATPARSEKASDEASTRELGLAELPQRATADTTRLFKAPDFSERQMAILAGICRGEPNKIIGRALNLPESTVKVHVREIMRKLAVSNRTQIAIAFARMAQPVAAAASISSRTLNSATPTIARNSQVCDAIPLVPSADKEVAGEIGKPAHSDRKANGGASTTR